MKVPAYLKKILSKFPLPVAVGDNCFEFVNPAFKELTGYTIRKLKKVKPEEFFRTSKFKKFFELEVPNTLGKKVWARVYTIKATIEGSPTKIFILVNKTTEKFLERNLSLLAHVLLLMLSSNTQEELLLNIVKTIVMDFDVNCAFLVSLGKNNNPVLWFSLGEPEGFLEELPLKEVLKLKNKVYVAKDVSKGVFSKTWEALLKKYDYKSFFVLPIVKDSKVVGYLVGFSFYAEFFDEEFLNILYEIQYTLKFSFKRFETLRENFILNAALEKGEFWASIVDERGRFLYVNNFACNLMGWTKKQALKLGIDVFGEDLKNAKAFNDLKESMKKGEPFTGIFVLTNAEGEKVYLYLQMIPVILPCRVARYVLIGRDVSLEVDLLSTIETLKTKDELTGLYNLTGILEEAEKILKIADLGVAFCLLFIRRIDWILALYGSSIKDELIVKIAEFLKEKFPGALIARISEDTFLLVFLFVRSKGEMYYLIHTILDRFKEPIKVKNMSLTPSVNLGVSFYPEDGETSDELYYKAHIALKQAKAEGPNKFYFYSKEMEHSIKKILEAEELIKEALSNKLFTFYIQPYFSVKKDSIAGGESLVRIVKDGEVIPPTFFIEELENSEYLKEFEHWALQEVVNLQKEFKIPLAINLTPERFYDIEFWKSHRELLKNLEFPLVLEITERGILKNLKRAQFIIEALKEEFKNIKVAIDDFGTGQTNFNYLVNLKIDLIKIDMSYVQEMLNNKKTLAIVDSIIYLAKRLGVETLAEGVETEAQVFTLKQMGCDYLQGFYFSKPLDKESFKEFLKKFSKDAS